MTPKLLYRPGRAGGAATPERGLASHKQAVSFSKTAKPTTLQGRTDPVPVRRAKSLMRSAVRTMEESVLKHQAVRQDFDTGAADEAYMQLVHNGTAPDRVGIRQQLRIRSLHTSEPKILILTNRSVNQRNLDDKLKRIPTYGQVSEQRLMGGRDIFAASEAHRSELRGEPGAPAFFASRKYALQAHPKREIRDSCTFHKVNCRPQDTGFQLKVLCIQMMQLLGPTIAQGDVVERTTFLLDQRPYRESAGLHLEDLLDYVVMDPEEQPP